MDYHTEVFITGMAGFMGNALAHRLSNRCVGTTRREHDWCNAFVPGGLKADTLIHTAFKPTEFSHNELMARNVANACLELETKRVILLSSGSIYQEKEGALTESSALSKDFVGYAASCRHIEDIFHKRITNTPLVIVRLFYPYGPKQGIDRLIPRLAKSILDDTKIPLNPLFRPRLNPIYIDDAAEVIARLIEAKLPSGVTIVNVAGSEVVSVYELSLLISSYLDRSCRFTIDPKKRKAFDIYASIDKVSRLSGYTPKVRLASGLREALKGFSG